MPSASRLAEQRSGTSYLAPQRPLAAEARTYDKQAPRATPPDPRSPATPAPVASGDTAAQDVDPGEELLAEDHDGEEDPLEDVGVDVELADCD